jgi:hypothetical protein
MQKMISSTGKLAVIADKNPGISGPSPQTGFTPYFGVVPISGNY